MDAYRETIDYMYSDNPQAIKDYAEFTGVPEATARRVRDEFFAKSLLDPDQIAGLDPLVKEAVTLKFIERPLTPQQLAELIQIPPRKEVSAFHLSRLRKGEERYSNREALMRRGVEHLLGRHQAR